MGGGSSTQKQRQPPQPPPKKSKKVFVVKCPELVISLKQGNTAACLALISDDTCNTTDEIGNSVLAIAIDRAEPYRDVIRALLSKSGLILNTPGPKLAPLNVAAKWRHKDILAALLDDSRIDVNFRSGDNSETALHTLTNNLPRYQYDHKATECMQVLLLKSGIDPLLKTKSGFTVLHNLASRGLYSGMVSDFLRCAGMSDNINEFNDYSHTPLMAACVWNSAPIVRMFINNPECDPNEQMVVNAGNGAYQKGYTALHLACQEEASQCISLLLGNAETKVNIQADNGDTPLHIISRTGKQEMSQTKFTIIQALLSHGAQADLPNKAGQTPMMMIRSATIHSEQHQTIVDLMQRSCTLQGNGGPSSSSK
eukprot:TRINITY_DN14084_c0_g1_i1.p1 TRINITY_DN14084_c0_g1~~TRINITY_DN14084_c0_g1_i1.p1  ORF type:complete len:368 (-),score=19.59 TRINITY_DN14084_c0_g1_i1:140-1243(-)